MHPLPHNRKEIQSYPRYTELCPNCFKIIFERKDFIHGHYFCENCGYVTKDILVVDSNGTVAEFKVSTLTKKRIPDHFSYPHKSIHQLRKKYENVPPQYVYDCSCCGKFHLTKNKSAEGKII